MKQTLLGLGVVLLLLAFAGVGVAHIFNPDWFIKRSSVRKGGEMLSEYNRAGFQIVGAVLAGGALYVLYSLFRH